MNPGSHHGAVRAATLLSCVRASALPVVPRPCAGGGTHGGNAGGEGYRAKLRGPSRRVRRGDGRKDDDGGQAGRGRRGGWMSDVAFWGQGNDPALEPFRRALRAEWERRGYEFVDGPDPMAACVFNFVDPDDPKPFRRRQRSTYVIAVHYLAERPDDVLRYEYPMLVRALANIAMLVVPGDACYFVTPEQGFYSVPDPGRSRGVGAGALRPDRAAGDVAARDRQPLRDRPRARALGRRRADRGALPGRPPARRAGPPARAVSRSRIWSPPTTCAGSSSCTGSAASPTATCRRARTTAASGCRPRASTSRTCARSAATS